MHAPPPPAARAAGVEPEKVRRSPRRIEKRFGRELSAAVPASSDRELKVPAGDPCWSEMVVLRVATTQFSAHGDDFDANIRRADAVVRCV